MPRITIFNEYRHERQDDHIRSLYPDGIHRAIEKGIAAELASQEYAGQLSFRTATQDEPGHGLSAEILEQTDTLLWWAHLAHDEVSDETAGLVQQAVLAGMGLIVLHSAHFSKPFRALMGTNCSLYWREADDLERIWNIAPAHPIMRGVPEYFELEREEMYGERFDVPEPDELLALSWFSGGEVFRSLCTWRRGHGQVVYFRPGHETYPTFHDSNVLRIITNAALWSARTVNLPTAAAPNAPVSAEQRRLSR